MCQASATRSVDPPLTPAAALSKTAFALPLHITLLLLSAETRCGLAQNIKTVSLPLSYVQQHGADRGVAVHAHAAAMHSGDSFMHPPRAWAAHELYTLTN